MGNKRKKVKADMSYSDNVEGKVLNPLKLKEHMLLSMEITREAGRIHLKSKLSSGRGAKTMVDLYSQIS